MTHELKLANELQFEDLYTLQGLKRIDALFTGNLQKTDANLAKRLDNARLSMSELDDKEQSNLIIELAPHVDDFIGELFDISNTVRAKAAEHHDLAPVFTCRRLFVQRTALKKIKADEALSLDGTSLKTALEAHLGADFTEITYATKVLEWMDDSEANAEQLDLAARFAAWHVHTPETSSSVLFKEPEKVDPFNLVRDLHEHEQNGACVMTMDKQHLRQRPGFKLTDLGTDLAGAISEATYCIFCHNQGKDSCSKGLRDRKTNEFRKTPFNVDMIGCPLEEKISEMHVAKSDGHFVGALAIAVIDNPMVAGTGHRICNECMKACIYQKQEPVDIPAGETRTLRDVLELPWGFEIYSLLSRWNPLNFECFLPKDPSGYKILVVGLGPAGFTLSHYLMNDGHAVVAIDGAKIEPVTASISGVTPTGERTAFDPVYDIEDLTEELDDRVMAGFGGVAEYGITVRWDKNFLKIIRLMLERRQEFAMFGGTRFGGSISDESAYAMGFDHVALCAGAGKPTILKIPNGLAPGVRQASDFLMGLQLTGAAKSDSITNLQVRLPVVVIGGGLTAIDTATESLAYYAVQVEKFLTRYEILVTDKGEEAVRAAWLEPEAEIADEFLTHGQAIRAEKQTAQNEGRAPRILEMLQSWGGAIVAYRRRMIDAPSYTLNHEEITKAMEEGIGFAELLSPSAIDVDVAGNACAIQLEKQALSEEGKLSGTGETITLPARTILVAAGTQPNTVLAREHGGVYQLDGKYFNAIDDNGDKVSPEWSAKPDKPYVLMELDEHSVDHSFFGDLHPSFSGNVVSAMASAKEGYPAITRSLSRRKKNPVSGAKLFEHLQHSLRPKIHAVNRLTPTIVEVVVHAPRAARTFQPGQFYRLQNFEALAPRVGDTKLAMEGLAMTGAWVDREKGLVAVIALEMGGSSNLCAHLKPGEPVVLMGPTGTPTEIPHNETVVLVGGGLGNAVLFSIGQALRAAGSQVLYFAGYKNPEDRYYEDNIEAASDMVIWCSDIEPGFEPSRPQDRTFVGNIVDAMVAYAKEDLGPVGIPLDKADRIIAIGSDGMMKAVGLARYGVLADYVKADHIAIGSINSPMQCMMKEICAQCLQRHVDPKTGEETVVFSCFNQDQPLDMVDFGSLRERLSQNATQEKLTAQWIARCLDNLPNTTHK
ncbi:MAG: FAD-dependent oxidoreductase [Rhodospirillales bacterium]|jgi:NADPH-dependent glutamate synthase beta subunit-like oxidoreductase/NAD(P)H-flavin reductase|nr:FAD-dependent oxidoreductase [Rhodospirillales bacterium]